MKYSFFPGCTMTTTGIEYGKSLDYVNRKIDLQLVEIPDWNCCGATAGHSISWELGCALSARNIALCEQQALSLPIAVACAACYSRMKHAEYFLRTTAREKLTQLIEMPVKGDLDVLSLLEVYGGTQVRAAISAQIIRPLGNLKVACYYGCLFSRPAEITGAANIENPSLMDEILALTGAEPIEWALKTECCGASHHVSLPRHAKKMLYKILKNARANGAQAIVTACPLCMMNLDMRQAEVNKDEGEDFDLPVYYFTEILAMAMGATAKEAGITTHFHPAQGLMTMAIATGEAG